MYGQGDSCGSHLDDEEDYDDYEGATSGGKMPLAMRTANSSGSGGADSAKMRVRNAGEKTPVKRGGKSDFSPLEMDNSVDGYDSNRVISVSVTDESVSGKGTGMDDEDDDDLQEIVLNTDRVPVEEREDKVIWTTPANEQKMDEGNAGGVTECIVTSIKLIMRGKILGACIYIWFYS